MRLYLPLMAAGLALAPMAAHAVVPVQDAVAELQLLKDYAQQLKAWVTQQSQAVSEANTDLQTARIYSQELETYLHFVENPSLGAADVILRQTGLGSDLPVDPLQMASLANGLNMTGGGLTGALSSLSRIGGYAGTAYNTNHVYTCDGTDPTCQDLNTRGNGIAGSSGFNQASYADVQSHRAAVQSLNDALQGTTDPAYRETIMAHLLAEQVWSENMHTATDQSAMQANLAEQTMRQRTLERQRQSADQMFADTQPITGPLP